MDHDSSQYVLIILLALACVGLGIAVVMVTRTVTRLAKIVAQVAAVIPSLAARPTPARAAELWEAYVTSLDTPDKFARAFRDGSFQRTLKHYTKLVESGE